MRTACIRGKMQETIPSVHDNLIPQLRDLRRIPMRYQRMLPLKVMKRYQCAVVGSAHGVLTVAITDRSYTALIEALSEFTGCTIFPVCVEPARMRLLIKRIERCEQRRGYTSQRFSLLEPLQIHTIMLLLSYQMIEEM